MEFGKWELRDNGYTSYYFSKDAMLYPGSNMTDSGKLHTEENVRNIYRDLTTKNFVTKYNYFSLSLNPNRNGIIVSPGEGVIQGYHFYAKNTIEVKVPNNTLYDESGRIQDKQPIEQFTLGISLTYDAANHVTGDVVNKEAEIGESEVLSGVYVAWFDECQLECNYDNILVLGRAWVQKGGIVQDGTILNNERIIYHGFETDPFKDHKFEAKTVEVEVHGHKTTKYDTLRDNMTQIHEPLYTYDSMHFPIELDRQDRTKPPSVVTDIQDYINHVPDWYTSKYGDYMTGALRFNNLSIDAKREFKKLGIIKDSTNNECGDSVFISPRTYGDLTRDLSKKVELNDYNYKVGGTIMTVVPNTYNNTTDDNNGYTGTHAALISQLNGETGLKIHFGKGKDESDYNSTRIVHYNELDDGRLYDITHSENTSKFIIENTDETGRKASINIKNGEIFIDSIVSPKGGYTETAIDNDFNGTYDGSGIQFFVSGEETKAINNIDFRIDESTISIANHKYVNHRTGTRGIQQLGQFSDDFHYSLGLGISYDSSSRDIMRRDIDNDVFNYTITKESNSDPYMTLGNLRIRSNSKRDYSKYEEQPHDGTKQTTIELLNYRDLPFLRIRPRVYSEQYVAEELFQVGTKKYDDLKNNEAQLTADRIIMKKIGLTDLSNFDSTKSLTYFEQDYSIDSERKVLNKMMPTINNSSTPNFEEIAGMLSSGNVGCSNKEILAGTANETLDKILDKNSADKYNPYTDESEWVRFTRFRYDLDRDQVNGGTNELNHDSSDGRKWGDTYNIEFNTQVANRRANQIIWRYKGSTGNANSVDNPPPVVLSYIHDSTAVIANKEEDKEKYSQGEPTKYTNIGDVSDKGTFETWIDHAGVTQYNPTYKTRDFLLLENAGLVVTGDINNPSLFGDTLNTNNHLGVTIVGGRVYNAVYNDFAETYEKDNINEIAQVGELISLNPETGKYVVCEGYENNLVVGVQSTSYAFLAGGNRVNKTQDVIDLENEYFTVGIAGKVWTRVDNAPIVPGDLLISSTEKGKATVSKSKTHGTIIGKALTKSKYFEKYNCNMVLMQIMLS